MAGLGRDRGQLLIVGALAIAVLILGLGAVFNSPAVTEQVAGSAESDDAADAEQFRYAARRGVAGTLRAVNFPEAPDTRSHRRLDDELPRNLTDSSHAVRRGRLAAEGGNWSGLTASLDAVEKRGTRTELVGVTNGSRIAQYEHRNFTNQSGGSDWTLVENASGVRAYRLNVSRDSLADCSTTSCFAVEIRNDTSTWTVTVGNETGDVRVSVTGPNGTDTCTASGEDVLIDLPAATVGGEDCGALAALEAAEPPVTLAYRNGDRAAGRYHLVVNATVTEEPHFRGAGGPEVAPALYGAEVRLRLRTETLAYRTTIRIVPGELDA